MPDFQSWMWWMMGTMMSFGLVLLIGILTAIALAVVWLVRSIRQPHTTNETPLAILERRYARGEISLEQYEEMKRHLSEG